MRIKISTYYFNKHDFWLQYLNQEITVKCGSSDVRTDSLSAKHGYVFYQRRARAALA